MAFDGTTNGTTRGLDVPAARVPSDNIDLSVSDADRPSGDQDVLSELVRDRCVIRLREALVHNLRDTGRDLQTTRRCGLEQRVDVCVVEMETRALRRCVEAGVYSRAMSDMIDEVEACTSESVLHDSLRHLIDSDDEPSPEINYRPAIGTRADASPYDTTPTPTESAAGDPLTDRVVDDFSAVDGVPGDDALLGYSRRRGPNRAERPDDDDRSLVDDDDVGSTADWVTDVLDGLNSPAAGSYVLTAAAAALPESDVFDDLNSVLRSSFGYPGAASLPAGRDLPSFDTFLRYVRGSPERGDEFAKLEDHLKHIESRGPPEERAPDPTTPRVQIGQVKTGANDESSSRDENVRPENAGKKSSGRDAGPVGAVETSEIPAVGHSSWRFDTFPRHVRGSSERGNDRFSMLEESLQKSGSQQIECDGPGETSAADAVTSHSDYRAPPARDAADRNVIRMSKVDEVLKSELKSAVVVKALELRTRTSRLPRALRARLEQRYADLFGDDHDYEPDPLTDEEQRIVSHRRIVSMVVGFMNPYYAARRINKRLFRDLAKIISRKLIHRSFDPDKEMVERMVKACFVGDKPIETAEELYLITTKI